MYPNINISVYVINALLNTPHVCKIFQEVFGLYEQYRPGTSIRNEGFDLVHLDEIYGH